MSWEAAVADLQEQVSELQRQLQIVTTPGSAGYSTLMTEARRQVDRGLQLPQFKSLTEGLEEALRYHCENAAMAMEIKALECCLGDAANTPGTVDLDELTQMAASPADGAFVARYHDPIVNWHDEDGGDAVSPESTPAKAPRSVPMRPSTSSVVDIPRPIVKAMLYAMSEVEQWWRERPEILQQQSQVAKISRSTQTDDFVDFHALSQLAFPSSSDFEVTPEVRHLVAMSAASQKRVGQVFERALRFDQNVLRELSEMLKRVTAARDDLPAKHSSLRRDAFADAIERYALGLESDPHSSFRKARGDKIIKEVLNALPEVRLFTCLALGPTSVKDSWGWGQIEITTHSMKFYPVGLKEELQDEAALRQVPPLITIPIEHIAYCATLISTSINLVRSGARPRLPLREQILLLSEDKTIAELTEELFAVYGRDAFQFVSTERLSVEEKHVFIIATPEHANELRLWCWARMQPKQFTAVFPHLQVPACWSRTITPFLRRNVRYENFQPAPVTADLLPASSAKLWPMNFREKTLCGTHLINPCTFLALRDVLLRDPGRQWFSVLDVATRLAQPLGELDWTTAAAIALDFCYSSEVTAVQLIEILPPE